MSKSGDVSLIERCFRLREIGYRPNQRAKVGADNMEICSYPYPDDGRVRVLARKPGRPETAKSFLIPGDALEVCAR